MTTLYRILAAIGALCLIASFLSAFWGWDFYRFYGVFVSGLFLMSPAFIKGVLV